MHEGAPHIAIAPHEATAKKRCANKQRNECRDGPGRQEAPKADHNQQDAGDARQQRHGQGGHVLIVKAAATLAIKIR